MRNIATALILFVLVVKTSTAQTKESRSVLFGIKLGYTHTNMNFNKGYPAPVTPISSSLKGGLLAGMMLNVVLADRLSFQPEYSFLTSSSTRNDSAITYHLVYFSFPLLLKYNLFQGLYFSGGAQFDLLLSAKKEAGSTSTITRDTEERNIGLTGRIEYLFKNNFSLSAMYTHGLNHIGIGQGSNVQEYKSQQIVLAAGFYF